MSITKSPYPIHSKSDLVLIVNTSEDLSDMAQRIKKIIDLGNFRDFLDEYGIYTMHHDNLLNGAPMDLRIYKDRENYTVVFTPVKDGYQTLFEIERLLGLTDKLK